MFLSVIPLKHSLSTKPFTYSVSDTWKDHIQIGSLVEIPIGKHLDLWIISEILLESPTTEKEYFEIKPIIALISETPLITEEMVAMVFQISQKYFVPIHKIISLFLPTPLLSRLDKKNYLLEKKDSFPERDEPVREIHHFTNRIFSPKDMERYATNGNIFCFPDDLFALSFFPKETENTDILLNESTPTKKSQIWIDIYEWKRDIIIWTRRILYYNLKAYNRIIYIEDSFGNEQFQYPTRLRTLDILRSLADNTQKDIIIITSTPSLSLFADFRDFHIRNQK